MSQSSAGGAGDARGGIYQAQVAAWVAVQMLAGRTSEVLRLDCTDDLSLLGCNTGEPVDDLLVRTAGGGSVFAQVTLGSTLKSSTAQKLQSFALQCVKQLRSLRNHATASASPYSSGGADRPYRILLITNAEAGLIVKRHLRAALEVLPGRVPLRSPHDADLPEDQQAALDALVTLSLPPFVGQKLARNKVPGGPEGL